MVKELYFTPTTVKSKKKTFYQINGIIISYKYYSFPEHNQIAEKKHTVSITIQRMTILQNKKQFPTLLVWLVKMHERFKQLLWYIKLTFFQSNFYMNKYMQVSCKVNEPQPIHNFDSVRAKARLHRNTQNINPKWHCPAKA